MSRAHKKTGGKPGGQVGNANALKHGAYSLREKAEHLRAHAALRAVRTLHHADRMEEQVREAEEAEAEARTAQAAQAGPSQNLKDMFARLKGQKNLRGVFVDLVHDAVAMRWLALFPLEAQPDWVWSWANILPNAAQSPAFEDGHDIAPGVPGEGYTPGENTGTTPPRRHTRTKIDDFIRGWWCYANATSVTDEMIARFLASHPEFGSTNVVRGFLDWGIENGLFARP